MSFVAVLPSIYHSKVQFACVVVMAFNAGFMAHALWLAAL